MFQYTGDKQKDKIVLIKILLTIFIPVAILSGIYFFLVYEEFPTKVYIIGLLGLALMMFILSLIMFKRRVIKPNKKTN